MRTRVASVCWKLREIRGDSGYFGHFHDLVSMAYDEGAEVVVFPELHVLELLSIHKDLHERKAARYLVQYAEAVEEWLARIASSSGLTIVGGSHFRKDGDAIKNVCAIAEPDKPLLLAQKNNLTEYERAVWDIAPGQGLARFGERFGVTVCYDSEFPTAGRNLADAGVTVQCVPSWTETRRGFQRVRWSCLARAIENQVFVIHSALVGGFGREPAPWSYGSSAIIAPSIEPFPEKAILRESELNEEGVIIADLDFDDLERARTRGEVANWRDRDAGDWTVRG